MSEHEKNLEYWLKFLTAAEIPVLKHTARELERLHADEENLGARSVSNVVMHDPLMAVKLLRFMQNHKHSRQMRDLVQIEQAIMMMGTTTFFRDVPAMPIVEEMLHEHLDALVRLLRTVQQAQRAAHYAFDWALLLHDLHAEEVRIAALLSYLGEMLMWCFNPLPMLEIRRRQEADKTLRSATVQEEVLGFKGLDLQRALATHWNLPQLLKDMLDPALAENPRVKNVMLAINLARHSANGWDDAALPDDYKDIGALLRMKPEDVKALVMPKEEAKLV
ncbi:metal-dependent hydrolase [Novimethylophilus kurashikiensis]|uniref:Metal-dependent hydrolase n=1 Tax=Novimethylophilus kurashikiensis TaxID=1825523 RepID=A0A2R5FHK2_9PROT|nr:HDOD domain-containing protein [Novimethylophilus kurashikiensis]GBG15571.1 metal-dependent hydrolase [Novimethylophilus kurashikiensis]